MHMLNFTDKFGKLDNHMVNDALWSQFERKLPTDTWICDRCDGEFSDAERSYETENGQFVCKYCMEYLNLQAELREDK